MKRFTLIGAAVALFASIALAQPTPGGGQGPGGQRRMQMMGRGGGVRLIMRPDVQKELSLTEDQKSKLSAIFPQPQFGGQGGPGGGGGRGATAAGGGQGGPGGGGAAVQGGQRGQGGPRDPQAFQEQQKKQEDAVKAILTEQQNKRFAELRIQFDGPSALYRDDVAKQVGLTDDQKKKLDDIRNASMQAMRDRMQEARDNGDDREAMRGEIQKLREANDKQILGVLTDEQKKKWDAMQGKKFTFEMNGR
jgi:Spy/CpxP family protein refolding chaperone